MLKHRYLVIMELYTLLKPPLSEPHLIATVQSFKADLKDEEA